MDVTTATFEDSVIEASRSLPVVVDIWAPWCGPCRTLGPIIERVAADFTGRVALVKLNSDENPELSQAFGIRSIPTVIAFKDGQPVSHFLGALPEAQVRAFFESLLPVEVVAEPEQEAAVPYDGPPLADLHARLEASPADLEAWRALAAYHEVHGAYAQAMEALLEIVHRERNWRDGEARNALLALFEKPVTPRPLVAEYRRKLATALH